MSSFVLRSAAIAVAAFLVSLTGLSAASTTAHAEIIPFWEQADIDAKRAKSARRSGYSGKYSAGTKKRVASKKSRKKLGGYAAKTEPKRYKGKRVKVAALGDRSFLPPKEPAPSLTGSGVRWVASSGCLDGGLKSIVYQVAANFGPVTVNSTCRSKGRNRAVGGAKRSKHLTGDAVDFRVRGNVRAVYAYLRSAGGVGGLKHYGGGLFHIDNGDRRSW
jgi:hypothetical protein